MSRVVELLYSRRVPHVAALALMSFGFAGCSADMQTRLSGVADHYAQDDTHALALARRAVANLNDRKRLPVEIQTPVHAGGIASSRTRARVAAETGRPLASTMRQLFPALRRRSPGW